MTAVTEKMVEAAYNVLVNRNMLHIGTETTRAALSAALAAAPSPSSGFTAQEMTTQILVNTLSLAEQFIANGLEYGFIKIPEGDPANDTLPAIREALSLFRKTSESEGSEK